ncbi:MAG: hypothetical protein EF812_04700 [Methanosarcinales archaeon]|nr:MAG: hypothetical protein EF812_04700 [Methanosarcinales archaeon]
MRKRQHRRNSGIGCGIERQDSTTENRKTDVPLEVEHIIPKSRGGTDRVSNLAISCH